MSESPSYRATGSVERRERLSYEEWAREYLLKNRPVIIQDAMPEWRAMTQWTPELLKQKLGKKPLRIGPDYIPFDEIADAVVNSSDENPGPYLRNVDIEKEIPEIYPDVLPRLRYASPNWKASRLMPKDWIFPDELVEIFFGGRGTQFPQLHQDWWGMHVFVTQVYGNKRALLFHPDDRPYLYPTKENTLFSAVDNFEDPDFARFPKLQNATPHWATLKPGETLFVPPGWWHTTRMLEVSITVITVNWNQTNWGRFVREVLRTKGPKNPLKAVGIAAYMTGVGAALKVRDTLRRWPQSND